MTPAELVSFLESRRFPLTEERKTQSFIAAELTMAGISFRREVKLGDGDRIDFLIGNVGVEIKLKGQRREIYRQCERYCGHDDVAALVLATNAAMGMPHTIRGKSVFIAHLGRAWL